MTEPDPLVAVLAAGGATRFGGGKLDAMLAGKRLGQWSLDAVAEAGLAPGVIVVGEEPPEFARQSGWPLKVNRRASEGLGTSLAMAAREAQEQGRALLVLLADMPLLDPGHLGRLAQAGRLAATSYPGGRLGVPAVFPPEELPALEAMSGDAGAGALLSGRSDVIRIDPPPDMLLDIDTPDDLTRAESILSRRG